MTFWEDKSVLVTGGSGFFGGFVVEALRSRGVRYVFVPRRRDYDLVDRDACRRTLADSRPDVVFHLAARVGGIGGRRVRSSRPGLETPRRDRSALFRPTEVDHLRGDAGKARGKLGWKPTVVFRNLIEMMVLADKEDVSSSLAGRPPRT